MNSSRRWAASFKQCEPQNRYQAIVFPGGAAGRIDARDGGGEPIGRAKARRKQSKNREHKPGFNARKHAQNQAKSASVFIDFNPVLTLGEN